MITTSVALDNQNVSKLRRFDNYLIFRVQGTCTSLRGHRTNMQGIYPSVGADVLSFREMRRGADGLASQPLPELRRPLARPQAHR